jgi:hypothetical protein
VRPRIWSAVTSAAIAAAGLGGAGHAAGNPETATRVQIAAATFEDTLVVDCQLPGRLQQLGGMRTYLTPGALTRLPAIDCRTRGGEYTVGDLASGPLSLRRWLPLAEKDNVEAQYYVARIYANAMDGVPADYLQAARWYQRAAQKKYAPAMTELGYLYEQGLGVPKDVLAGLNLERAATGLGDELVYSSVLTANRQEADARIAALTDQLDATTQSVRGLQDQLSDTRDRLSVADARLGQDQTRLRALRSRLELARRESGGDPARVKALQEQLATDEGELKAQKDALGIMSADMQAQQAQLAARVADSQTANAQLNGMLAAGKSDSDKLRSQLAQSEQRALQSQQELDTLRARFLDETQQLNARSSELAQLRQHGNDGLQSVLDAKQAEIERQQQRATTLQQQQELQTLRAEYARLQSQSKDDRDAVVAQLSAQLASKTAALEDDQKKLGTLQLETSQLRDTYNKEREERARDTVASAGERSQDKDALREAQLQLSQQRDALQQLQTQAAAQQIKLVQERESLAGQLAGGQAASQQRIAALEADLRDRDRQIADARARVGTLEQQRPPQVALADARSATVANNITYRMPQAATATVAGGAAGGDSMLQLVQKLGTAKYHALVIGNSSYHNMSALKTPANDAREIASVLEGRYGFDVKLLVDATRQQIGQAMYEYQHTLTDSDRLLIYYAGHGGSKDLPPERAYWQGVDSTSDDQSTWLSAIDVGEFIAQIHARHVLLVSDSCFSGVITHQTSTIVAPNNDERSVTIKWNRAARMVLTSGQNEPVVDSSAPDPDHSLFAEQFLTVLRQNSILLSGEMLAHEVSERMETAAARIGVRQMPSYSNLQDKQHMFGDFFFVPIVSNAAVTARTG